MMRRRLTLVFLTAPIFAFAQEKKPTDNAIVVVAGKPLTRQDSVEVSEYYFSALREKTIENFPRATEYFNHVLQIDPANDAAMYELATIKKLKNDYVNAQQLLEQAVTVNPDNEWYWVSLADCYEETSSLAKLQNVFTELTRINPENPDYYFDRANAYFLEGKYDDALNIYDQLEKLTGITDDIVINRQKIYLKQGKVDKAAAQLETLVAANPANTKYSLMLAQVYNSNSYTDKALKILLKAEKTDPGNSTVHLALADIYREKKDYEDCFNELERAFAIPDQDVDNKIKIVLGYIPKFPDPNAKASALQLSKILSTTYPQNAKVFALYGNILIQCEKTKESEDAYRRSIALDNNVYIIREQLVRIELSDNAIEDAIKDGEDALSLFPNQAWMNYLVGVAWAQKKDNKKAVEYLKAVPTLDLEDKDLLSLTYSTLGDCYHSLNDNKNSDSSYVKALVYNPDNAYTLNNYAYYLSLRDEQLEKAAQMSARSNELQPANASFEDTYAWILFRQKNYPQAKLWMEKALADDKSNSATQQEHYGDIVFKLGDIDTAVQYWKKAKANGGGSALLDRKINEKKYIE